MAKKWTVMVFMGTADPTGKNPLDKYSRDDRREMARVGSDPALNIFSQVHGEGVPRRRHVKDGVAQTVVPEPERDPTNGHALVQFIKWALKTAKHDYENDCSMLVIWGHAFRFETGAITTLNGFDALDFGELSTVLRHVRNEFGGKRLDVLGFDACDLSTIEVAYRLREFADYLLASQTIIPLPGWPYHRVLDQLRKSQGRAPMTPENLGEYVVRRFCERYSQVRPSVSDRNGVSVSLTLLDLRKAAEVFDKTEALARGILALSASEENAREIQTVKDCFQLAQTSPAKPFVDVATLCLHLWRNCRAKEVRIPAIALGNLLIRPGLNGQGRGSFVVEHGRNSHQTAGLQGVSLYAPHVAMDTHDWTRAADGYSRLLHGVPRQSMDPEREKIWSQLIYAFARGASH